ncbi:MAG: TRAP transporter small permease [Pseudomonadota bacterium]
MTGDSETLPQRAGRWLALLPSLLAAAVLFALMMMTFFDVILRSTINDPIESATELTRLFMGIMVFAALPVISWRGEHIVVDLFDPLFGETAARIRDAIVNLACGGLLFWPAIRVWALAERAKNYGDVTEYLNIPQFYIAYFIAVSTFVTAVALVARGLAFLLAPGLVYRKPPADAAMTTIAGPPAHTTPRSKPKPKPEKRLFLTSNLL